MTPKVRRNQWAKKLIPLVHEVAAQVARRVPAHVSLEDLVSAGMLGLAGALNRFEPDRAKTFKGYAEFRIRGEIMDELRRRDIMSRDARIESKKLQREIANLSQELGRQADDDEVAEHLGMSLDDYRKLQLRLNDARVISSEGLEFADQRAVDPSDRAQTRELGRQFARHIERLNERHQLVLWLYYFEELPLREIGDVLGVTPSRVCQIRTEAVERLRCYMGAPRRVAA